MKNSNKTAHTLSATTKRTLQPCSKSDRLNNYPVYKKKSRISTIYFNWTTRILILSTIISIIVNVLVGGGAWSVYVVVGVYIYNRAFLAHNLIETSLIRKILSISLSLCILLISIRIVSNYDFLNIQIFIPNLLYGALLISGFLYFFDFQSQKSHLIPILTTIGIALTGMAVVIFVWGIIKWPMIVLGSISLFIILFSMIFYRKPVIAEIKKKIHI